MGVLILNCQIYKEYKIQSDGLVIIGELKYSIYIQKNLIAINSRKLIKYSNLKYFSELIK